MAFEAQKEDVNPWTEPSLRDADVSDKGMKQIAESIAKQVIEHSQIDLVLVSPLKRAM